MLELLKKSVIDLLLTVPLIIAGLVGLAVFAFFGMAVGVIFGGVLETFGVPSSASFTTAIITGLFTGGLMMYKLSVREAEKIAEAPAVPLQPPFMGREFFTKGDALVHEERRLEAELADVRRRRAEYEEALLDSEVRKERVQYEQRL